MSIPQSLPSFAQAFSNSSLNEATPISNALPPIQKKRSREDPPPPPPQRAPVDADASCQSPMAVRIKEEDRDDPQSPPALSRDSSATPGAQPLSKRRRVTVSSASAEQATPIPTSPVVSTFSLPDDAAPRDQPRSILAKQPQKPLVDQRRASISSTAQSPMVSGIVLSRSPPGDQLTTSKFARIGRVSPSVVNRCAGNAVASGSQATATSPPPIIAQQPPSLTSVDPSSKQQQPPAVHSLPPPPISFARRRAAQSGGRKRKPADILISPRGAGPSDPLAPVIQSAPPVADPGRFPMAIPRLPLALNNAPTTRRVAGNVPPTPTRFSLQATAAPSISTTVRTIPSPPNLSVPIANTLVPPTPHSLHHPGYTGDKSAFLAPFEVFYDALNDSKQLKSWLSDQLQKSNALMVSLKQQQDKMDEIVEDLVEKRTRIMREEFTMLRQRMESLEEALLAVRAESSTDPPGYGYSQGTKGHQNGVGTDTPSSYSFPAPEQRRPDPIIRISSPGREREHQLSLSPPVEVARRLSVSATTSRPEHSPFSLGGHRRRPSGSQGSAKCTPPVRPVAERSTRPTESRTAPRLYYPGTYGNGNSLVVEGQTMSRDGNKS
ncbi:hypothetical protein OG21DRAFT_366707 [Imleria badia]|nr:hypothetical protein OG21DRAFT_366707 [Imleria badia]